MAENEEKTGKESKEVKKPTLESIAKSAEPTPVLIAAEQPPVPMTIEGTEESPLTVTPSGPIPVTATPDAPLTVTATPDAPVAVTADKPLPVILEDPSAPPPRPDVVKGEGVTLAPTTTEQEDMNAKGRRQINRVWEYTQAGIAISITLAIIYCAANKISSQDLTNSFFLIIGFYFSRTNHQAQGGTGPAPLTKTPQYMNRLF